MIRSIGIVFWALVVRAASAAPVPGEKPFQTSWDPPTDPDGDCTFQRVEGKLTITLPGSDHDLGIERGRMNAPRLLRDVEGDFVVQVRVGGLFRPSTESGAVQRVP